MLKKDVHIGSVVRKIFEEKQMTIVSFARELGCDRTCIYSLFDKKSIDTDQLIRVSKVLNHNFLLEYFDEKEVSTEYILLVEVNKSKIEELRVDSSVRILKSWEKV